MARNRYGWQKRAKELARKQKNDDKMKRRQGKAPLEAEEGMPESEEMLGAEEILGTDAPDLDSLPETDPAGPTQPQ